MRWSWASSFHWRRGAAMLGSWESCDPSSALVIAVLAGRMVPPFVSHIFIRHSVPGLSKSVAQVSTHTYTVV